MIKKKGHYGRVVYSYEKIKNFFDLGKNDSNIRRKPKDLKAKWKQAVNYARKQARLEKPYFVGKGMATKYAYELLVGYATSKVRWQKDFKSLYRDIYGGEYGLGSKNDAHRLDKFMNEYGKETYNPTDQPTESQKKKKHKPTKNEIKKRFKQAGKSMKELYGMWLDWEIADETFYEILRDFQGTNAQYKRRKPNYEKVEFEQYLE